jgi:hypothetical protein
VRRARKLTLKLGGDPADDEYPDKRPDKPKRMRWTTYNRLMDKARCGELAFDENAAIRFQDQSVTLSICTIAKKGSEVEVLKMYQNSSGRSRVTTYVSGKSSSSIAQQFQAALHILHFCPTQMQNGRKKFGPATDAGATNFVRSTQAHSGL